MITELNITTKIDNDILIDMVNLATNYECLLAEKETNKQLEFDKQKSLDSTDFVSEISGNWALNKEPNFNDLNSKLGL